MQQSLAKSVLFCKSIVQNVLSPNTCTTGHSVINEKQSIGFLQNLFYFVNPLFKMSSHLTPVPLVTLLSTKNNQLASYTWHKFPQDKFSKKVARKMRSKNLRKKITLYLLQILKLFLLLVFIVSTFVNH